MQSIFKFIRPGPHNRRNLAFEFAAGRASKAPTTTLLALSMADSAANHFCGLADSQFNEGARPLPWLSDYWIESAESLRQEKSFDSEVEAIFVELNRAAQENEFTEPWTGVTFLCEKLLASQKLTMQGLAVETMLAVDGLLNHMQQGDLPTALEWLFAANDNFIQCRNWEHVIRESSVLTENARMAAGIRHKENRALKKEAFEWLDKNMKDFSSMDRAAQAITKQIPIQFRTARSWTGEWKKLQPARTL